jgi:oligoribonuclease
MPRLEACFHYRNIDVSSIKELVQYWYPDLPIFQKKKSHPAKSALMASSKPGWLPAIAELKR